VQRLEGIGVSPGVAAGRAVVLTHFTQVLRFSISAARVERELGRLEAARASSRQQLAAIRDRLTAGAGHELASLFDAQLLMLDDPMWLTQAVAMIREQRVNAEWAVQRVFDEISSVFNAVEDPYLRERQGDLSDLVGRLRMNLRHDASSPRDLFKDFDEPCILIADELTPSMAAQLDWSHIRAFATDAGSRTYHTAILARSLHVPAVVGLHDASRRVVPGALVVIDGAEGSLVLEAPASLVTEVQRQASTRPELRSTPAGEDTRTRDGVTIRLQANIELLSDVASARHHGADGVGLYRSEFLLMDRTPKELTEDVQFEVYRQMLERMAPAPVTVRTFDIDEDQLVARRHHAAHRPSWGEPAEHGRSRLGLRATRLALKRPELLRRQLRALLRAARHGDLRIMFPFISGVEEFREAKSVLADAAAELKKRGESVANVQVGVMIEVPSAAFTSDLLAREADFLTIGTNDLIQCCLAVDRTDDRVSHLYEPLHPSILRLIRMVRRAAARHGRAVSVCGEMASDPVLLALLVGMGLTSFSMAPLAIPTARQVLGEADATQLRRVAAHVLRLSSVPDIERYLLTTLGGVSVGSVTSEM
jgi:phosphotransferase system enzyme I (PtsI)